MTRLRLAIAAILVLLAPGLAAAACPEQSPTDTSACGPIVTLPRWSDSAGWGAESAWSTIQLGDVDGVPGADLLGRNGLGLWMHGFDAGLGQWVQRGTGRPVANLQDVGGWDEPGYAATLQTADVTGAGPRELIARGGSGLLTYAYSSSAGAFVPLGGALADLSDAEGWAQPRYYQTIQTAEVDGRPGAELLARSAGGLVTSTWNPATRTFDPLPGGVVGDLSDAEGWGQEAYYTTIQTADLDGDGRAELLARAASGLLAYRWGGSGWTPLTDANGAEVVLTDLSDANGFTLPQHYATIVTGNLDGEGGAEVIARTAAGIRAWSWSVAQSAWIPLPNARISLTGGDWREAQHYRTIQAGDVDGDGRDELVVRGVYGIRTFRLEPGTRAFVRPRPYGAFPAFEGPAAAAYRFLPTYLALAPGDLRARIADPDEKANLGSWQQNLVAGCVREAGVGVAGAARYASCPAPAGSGADGPTWTGVVNQINGELQSAIQANRHFDALDAALEDLLVDSNSELQAVKALTDIPPKATGTSFDWAALLDDVIFVLADLVGIPGVGEGGEAAAAASQFLYTAADSLGAVVDGTSSPGGGRSEASTWAQVTTQVAQVQQAMEDGLDVRRAYALGDPGLRGALGSMQYAGVMPVNRAAVQNAGRRAFAEWAFKSLLPAHWNRYRVPDCQTGLGLECGPPRGTSPTYIYSSFSAGDTDGWDLATVTDPDGTECWVDTFTQGCDFADVSSLKPFIWAARDPACVYDPVARTGAWDFGRCSIGADQADIAQGRDGWAFTGFTCVVIAANMGFDPCKPDDPANTVVRGSVPAGAAAGTVTLQATHDLGALAPAAGTVTAESLLVESTTRPPEDRELATQPTGLEHQPLRMTPTARPSAGSQGSGERTAMARRPNPVRATFRGRSGTQRASLTMTRSRLVLRVRGVRVGAPEACTKGARRVTLTTTLRLRPPGRPTARGTAVTLRGRWECRRGPQRAHAGLRLVAPRR